jgi:SWIM zinc finger
MPDWSRERVEQLAPDAASAKAGAGLAKPSLWKSLGRADEIIWGECQGSGANPYQVRVALGDAGYRCTCPSRKQPCKHTLALLFLYAEGDAFKPDAPPSFVQEWLENRVKRNEAKAAWESAPAAPPDPQAQAKRQEKRESRIAQGVQQLESWLSDIIAQGLASARTQPTAFWSQMAARLVDAQAQGLANRVRDMASIVMTEDRWAERLLAALARTQLLIDAYRRLEALPPDLAAEVRSLIGWTQQQDELRAQAGVTDRWQVLGKRHASEETLRVLTTWFYGHESKRIAVTLEFAVGKAPFAATHSLGQNLEAEFVFFPGIRAQRALIKPEPKALARSANLAPPCDLAGLEQAMAQALSANPWLEYLPAVIGPVVPDWSNGRWTLIDAHGRRAPLRRSFQHGWSLAAVAGGEGVSVFGEWDGFEFQPVTIQHGEHLYSLDQIEGLTLLSKAV